ncbi:MAG: hypothetical protein J6C77_03310 [Muribaculaceae bacterium]|nr:hypothetical protein [Muribaculaceae bacterium]
MKKNLFFPLACACTLMLAGCNGKMKPFQADYFSTNPNPLELVGQNVPATVTANIPAKFFKKNAQVTVTPTLVYGENETVSTPYALQGENVRGNATTVNYNNGGVVTIPVNYLYQPAMQKSELFLDFTVTQGKKQYVLPRVKVADGVIATSDLASAAAVSPAAAKDAFQQIINQRYSADIHFLINQAVLRPSELSTGEMVELRDMLVATRDADSLVLREINIDSYASPEGALDFNARLAENRQNTTDNYLQRQLKKDKITEFGELTSQFTAEDWEGFQKLVAASNIQDKELILNVLQMYKDPEEREREIRNLATVFEALADEILPQLRRSRITASIDVIGKTNEEINALVDSDPSKLSVEELLYAGTLTNDPARKQKIYEAVVKYYPNDYRGYNNLGMVNYALGDYAAASANLAKASQLSPSSKEVNMNQGLLSLLNKDFSAANRSFSNAAGLDGLGDALGVYYLNQGDNAAAVKAFGSSKTNNAALAKILTKDYAGASSTLSSIATPDAVTYYLTAIVGARTNNANMVKENLAKAIKLDPSLAARAANDLEFARFK